MRFLIKALTRLSCIGALAPVTVLCHAMPGEPPAQFNATTAPDPYSRAVLHAPLKRLEEGAAAGTEAASAIHRNFPQIIEQNFARLGATRVTSLVDSMSDRELHDLAQLYVNASADASRMQSLLPVLANRLDAGRLARISKHFGYAATYDAVVRTAPAKAFEFTQRSSPAYAAPLVGAVITPSRVIASGMGQRLQAGIGLASPTAGGIGQFLNMTPYEIYMDYRTAPVGALGVTGALYETTVTLSKGAALGWTIGYYGVGPVARDLIQTYAPDLYDAIGGTVSAALDNIQNAGNAANQGHYEEAAGDLFGLSFDVRGAMEGWGGDYGAASEWFEDVVRVTGCMSSGLVMCARP